jgi:Nuclear fragile X mental retardation-interacting protein 1 (NUFIP1)
MARPVRPDGIVPPNAPKLDTPEDLKKWIEERKRNWPSERNVAQKVYTCGLIALEVTSWLESPKSDL